MSTTHHLKSWPEFFEPVLAGVKPFEIRQNDRNFRVGDHLELSEYNPHTGEYTGRKLRATVAYMTEFLQRPGYVVLGLGEVHQWETREANA